MKQNAELDRAGRDGSAEGRRGTTVDILGHVRGLIRVAPVAVVIGIVVALGVFAYQSATATRYEATVVAQIVTPGSVATGQAGPTSTDAATAAGPFVALAGDQDVLEQIAKSAKIDVDPGTLSSQIVVAASQVPGIVDITADADSADEASRLADAVVTTLDSTYASRQQATLAGKTGAAAADTGMGTGLKDLAAQLKSLASQLEGVIQPDGTAQGDLRALDTQINQLQSQVDAAPQTSASTQRLILLAQPASGVKASTIPPVAIAFVAGLIAMIVAAELLVVLRSFLGRRVNREWARRVGKRAGAEVDLPGHGVEISSASLAAVARAEGPILVVASEGVRGSVSRIVAFAGVRIDGRDVDDEVWNRGDGDHELAVIVTREGDPHRAEIATALETLAAWNIPTRLVVVPDSKGTFALPGGLAVSFRKPAESGRPAEAGAGPVPNQAPITPGGPQPHGPVSPHVPQQHYASQPAPVDLSRTEPVAMPVRPAAPVEQPRPPLAPQPQQAPAQQAQGLNGTSARSDAPTPPAPVEPSPAATTTTQDSVEHAEADQVTPTAEAGEGETEADEVQPSAQDDAAEPDTTAPVAESEVADPDGPEASASEVAHEPESANR